MKRWNASGRDTRVILDELKPTKAQISRGLELHYNSFVADVQGSVQMSSTHGIIGDRLQADLEPFRKELSKHRPGPRRVPAPPGRNPFQMEDL